MEETNRIQASTPHECPIHKTIALFQKKWSMRVLFELSKCNTMRFSQLQRSISSITSTMLSATLRELADHGLVERIQYNEIPPRVEYRATEKTKALGAIFDALALWEDKYL